MPVTGKYGKVFTPAYASKGSSTAAKTENAVAHAGETVRTAKLTGQLKEAAKGKGNFSIGSATKEEADFMGKAWVGPNYKVASDGKTLVSADGFRQYRPPTFKPKLNKTQANFEQKFRGQETKGWQGNGHLDIN